MAYTKPFEIGQQFLGEGEALARAYAHLLPLELVDAGMTGRLTLIEVAERVYVEWRAANTKRPLSDDRLRHPVLVYIAVLGLLIERAEQMHPSPGGRRAREYVVSYSRDGAKWEEWARFVLKKDRWFPHRLMMELADANSNFHWRTAVVGTPIVVAKTTPLVTTD